MGDIRESLAMKLKNLIETKGVSQTDIAKNTGVLQSTISQMLPGINGEKYYPATSYENILALANYFDVSIDWLLDRTEHRSTSQNVIIAAETTGLSDAAIEQLAKWEKAKAHPLYPFSRENHLLATLDALITSKEGNDLLGKICVFLTTVFLTTDIKQVYIEYGSEDKLQDLYDIAKKELRAFQKKYSGIKAFAKLFDDIDRLPDRYS